MCRISGSMEVEFRGREWAGTLWTLRRLWVRGPWAWEGMVTIKSHPPVSSAPACSIYIASIPSYCLRFCSHFFHILFTILSYISLFFYFFGKMYVIKESLFIIALLFIFCCVFINWLVFRVYGTHCDHNYLFSSVLILREMIEDFHKCVIPPLTLMVGPIN